MSNELGRYATPDLWLKFYEAGCRAIADAKTFPDVKEVIDKAAAVQIYGKAAGNKQLEADAWEIRRRAVEKLGEVMEETEDVRAGVGKPEKDIDREPINKKPTLKQLGIDTHLADDARKAYALKKQGAFEQHIADGRAKIGNAAERSLKAKERRREKHRTIAESAVMTLAEKGPFPVIYADPPWKWGHFGEQDQENEEGKGRTPDQHYPTMTHEEILDYVVDGTPINEIIHRDAALFLWCTSSNIPRALEVMERWGFEFKASAAWVKMEDGKLQLGMGLVFRNAHEVLLYGTRGNMPGPQHQPPSVFLYPRTKHSAKPPEIRAAIERMYPDFDEKTRLELFAREQTNGWTSYGFESAGRSTD